MAPHSGRAQSLSVKRIAATLLSGDNGERGRVGRCAGVQVAGVGRRAGWEALRRAKGTSVAEGLTGVACARTDDAGRGGQGRKGIHTCPGSAVGIAAPGFGLSAENSEVSKARATTLAPTVSHPRGSRD